MQGVAPKQEHDEQEHDEQEHEPERAHEEPDRGGQPMPKPQPKPDDDLESEPQPASESLDQAAAGFRVLAAAGWLHPAAAAPVWKTRKRMTLKQLAVDKQRRQKRLTDANAVREHTMTHIHDEFALDATSADIIILRRLLDRRAAPQMHFCAVPTDYRCLARDRRCGSHSHRIRQGVPIASAECVSQAARMA